MKIVKKFAAVLAFVFTALTAQSEEMKKPELDGYCPVCYIAAGKAVEGKKEYAVEHEGKTYLFVNNEAVSAFEKEPAKYLPAYDGWCAYGISLGKKFESDPTVFKVVDGRLFLNKSPEVGELFSKGTEGHISKADAEWKKMAMVK
ncbi:YHS domain-containing (seleno)protein [Haloferula sp.]|uniref:YHS domain-containing (seleno)protein n=1 Tax=Haloferula sp. TaxID=2497595 RepID=UPI003C7554B5